MNIDFNGPVERILGWLAGQEARRWNSPVTDEEIWIRIGCYWPTYTQQTKQAIFKQVTGREYTCTTLSSQSFASSELSSAFGYTYSRPSFKNPRS